MKKLERSEMKNLKGGLEDDSAPLCTECSSDTQCRTSAPECRESTSCPNTPKVCARRHWA